MTGRYTPGQPIAVQAQYIGSGKGPAGVEWVEVQIGLHIYRVPPNVVIPQRPELKVIEGGAA